MEEDKLNEEKQNRENFHPMCVNHPIMKHIMIDILRCILCFLYSCRLAHENDDE